MWSSVISAGNATRRALRQNRMARLPWMKVNDFPE